MTYNIKTEKEKILRIRITIIRHGGLGHAVVFWAREMVML